MNRTAIFYALAAAALFGVSTPAAKALLGAIDPAMLAGLFYCGAGIGIAALRRIAPPRLRLAGAPETRLARRDLPWLAGAVACGGVAGPLLLMFGLARTEAATASLLLTLEAASTALIAWFVFHENRNARVAIGVALITAGALTLAWSGAPTVESVIGPLAVVAACIAWGLDNNLTRKVSLADPLQIAEIKGLVAGPVNLGLAWGAGSAWPAVPEALAALVVGFVGYGISVALYVLALRHLGAARAAAYFATAPFIGAAAAVLTLAEPISAQFLAAGALMALGVWLHVFERHAHEHVHERLVHSHPHVHDEHHQHAHRGNEPPGEPHTHVHEHAPLRHSHPHTPDMHHTHRHDR